MSAFDNSNHQKHICFILDGYPYKDSNDCVFAKHLICRIADLGVKCTVIAPQIITKSNVKKNIPYFREESTNNGAPIGIYVPKYIHFSSNKCLMGMSMISHCNAVMRVIRKEKLNPDCVYGHFIYQNGLTSSRIGSKLRIPSYCAVGENSTRIEANSIPYSLGLKHHKWASIISKLTGIVSVSDYNKRLLLENGYASPSMKIGVFPNGIDSQIFHPTDKKNARKKLRLPEDAFIIAFTGAFSERKGIGVLSRALDMTEKVYSVFLGKGQIQPDCHNILFSGNVKNDELIDYLNAADVFVLPTLGEGCCNAIVEALACGLPVISSNLPFNDDILDGECSIRVDPKDREQIADAIRKLQNDAALRKQMSDKALEKSKELQIEIRAKKILDFMDIDYD